MLATAQTTLSPGPDPAPAAAPQRIICGAEQTVQYFPRLVGKRLGVVCHQASRVGARLLPDTLRRAGFTVSRIFAPEHGFASTADAGALINSGRDSATGVPIRSLYGKSKRPARADLDSCDLILFDLQDVGARFYTYLSTLHYVLEACAEAGKPILILDRPNPNGMYVDGPVLEERCKSFVGIYPIPILHGCTLAELARMAAGEGWIANPDKLMLDIIPCAGYTHDSAYALPVRPSPNLATAQAVSLYPTLCLFEGTLLSVGRGTDYPFMVVGGADPGYGTFTFTPQPKPGATHPVLEGKTCYGLDLRDTSLADGIDVNLLITLYNRCPAAQRKAFFTPFFTLLAGTPHLERDIRRGHSAERIRKHCRKDLDAYKQMRERYLIYD